MKGTIFLTVSALLYTAATTFLFYRKDTINKLENRIFKKLLIITLFSMTIELLIIPVNGISGLSELIPRLFFVCILLWLAVFFMYSFAITSFDEKKSEEENINKYKKLHFIFVFINILLCFLVFVLPMEYISDGDNKYITGQATNLLFIVLTIYLIFMIGLLLTHIKKIHKRGYIPVIALIVLLILEGIVQNAHPEMLLANGVFGFIIFLMYHTIENPDVKIINELNKNRELVNKTFEDKSNFLFVTSNQLKSPLQKIEEISRNCIETNKNDIESIRDINNLSNNLLFQVNNVMDISSLTHNNIKVINDKYNTNILFNKIRLSEENKVKDGVKFNLNVNELVPKYLYGDSKLLEQVLISLVENAIKYTSSGFIDLNIDCIVKYDMCRLIFTIEDSGLGMTIDKINELLLVDNELSEEEIKRLDTKNININTIKKLVNKLGGYFTIKSEVGKGTEIKVVVDQKIENQDDINLNNVTTNQKILLATSNNELASRILKNLDKRGYAIDTSAYSNDILDRVRLFDKYTYIIIDDDMDKRALEILKELKKNPKFNNKVIVMIDKSLELVKDDLIKDGFYDCIFKEEIDKELERILD